MGSSRNKFLVSTLHGIIRNLHCTHCLKQGILEYNRYFVDSGPLVTIEGLIPLVFKKDPFLSPSPPFPNTDKEKGTDLDKKKQTNLGKFSLSIALDQSILFHFKSVLFSSRRIDTKDLDKKKQICSHFQ